MMTYKMMPKEKNVIIKIDVTKIIIKTITHKSGGHSFFFYRYEDAIEEMEVGFDR